MPTASLAQRVNLSLLWGVFCACSWTWCIGMYLPRIMIDRFGWWGFIAFAIPNVIGCATFGYIVRDQHRSRAMIAKHANAMIWFSSITVAFHVFFITFLFSILMPQFGSEIAPLLAAVVLVALGAVFSFLNNRDWLVLAVIIYAVSAATFIAIGVEPLQHLQWTGRWHSTVLIALIPFILFGFLLCPYLDLTFHRAIQNSPSKHAFAVFGITFAVMIILSIAMWFASGDPVQQPWFAFMVAHLVGQSVFTVGAHVREIRTSSYITDPGRRWSAMLLPVTAAPLLFIGRLFTDSPALNESMYLGILGLFGTMFPAWFVLQAIRTRQSNK